MRLTRNINYLPHWAESMSTADSGSWLIHFVHHVTEKYPLFYEKSASDVKKKKIVAFHGYFCSDACHAQDTTVKFGSGSYYTQS